MHLSKAATRYIVGVALVGGILIARGLADGGSDDQLRTFVYLVLTILAATMKFRLPGVTGTYSLSFLFILVSIVELGLRDVALIACAAAAVQVWWRPQRRPQPAQAAFNIGNLVVSATAAHAVYHGCSLSEMGGNTFAVLAVTAAVYFAVNTLLVSIVLCLVEAKPLGRMWEHWVFWALPYYLVGAVFAGAISTANSSLSWWTSLPSLPLAFICYRFYRVYVERSTSRQSV